MKAIITVAIALSLTGCAAGFDIRCPDGDPTRCSPQERAAAAAVGLSALQAVQATQPKPATIVVVPVPVVRR